MNKMEIFEVNLIGFEIGTGRCVFTNCYGRPIDDYMHTMKPRSYEEVCEMLNKKELIFCGYEFKDLYQMKKWVRGIVEMLDVRTNELYNRGWQHIMDVDIYEILITENPIERTNEALSFLKNTLAEKAPSELVRHISSNYVTALKKVMTRYKRLSTSFEKISIENITEINV